MGFLSNKVYEYISNISISSGKNNKKFFSVTDAGECERKIYYSFLNYNNTNDKIKIDPKVYLSSKIGDFIHNEITHYFSNMQILKNFEITIIDKEEHIKGRFDSIVEIDGDPYLVDIKSLSNYPFRGIIKSGDPKINNVYQIQLYMWLFMRLKDGKAYIDGEGPRQELFKKYIFKNDINKALILYLDRDSLLMEDLLVIRDDKIIEELLKRFGRLKYNIKKSILPGRSFVREDWHCIFCNYSNFCWKDK